MPETIIVSYSELNTAQQCGHKHELAYRERWRAPKTGPALVRGTGWHKILEGHYRVLRDQQRLARGLEVPGVELLSDKELSTTLWWSARQVLATAGEDAELLEHMYTGYLELYGLDPGWEILAVEHAPEVWLPTDRGGRSRFKLKLKIDLLVRERGRLWVVDHKSGKDLPNDKDMAFDDQFGLYTWAMHQLGHKVFGQVYSAARTFRPKDPIKHPQTLESRFRRIPMSRTDIELQEIAVNAYRMARQAYSRQIGLAPHSPDPDRCKWKCDFTESCLLGRKGMDERDIMRSTGYVQDFTRH